MIFSETQPEKKPKAKVTKPAIVSKIIVIKIAGDHIKILQRGDKVVVRRKGEILFNNLKTKMNFDKWWKDTIEALGNGTELNVIKSEVVDNKAMKAIHGKYGG